MRDASGENEKTQQIAKIMPKNVMRKIDTTER